MIEKELKVLLSKEKYEVLKNQFTWDEIRIQTNFYYTDKGNDSKGDGITIRVRECNNKVVLQIKIPVSEHGAIHIKMSMKLFWKLYQKI